MHKKYKDEYSIRNIKQCLAQDDSTKNNKLIIHRKKFKTADLNISYNNTP